MKRWSTRAISHATSIACLLLAAVPRAPSASFALASLLFLQDQREEAARLVDAAIRPPTADDPWRRDQSGDFRLWPQRIGALRKALE